MERKLSSKVGRRKKLTMDKARLTSEYVPLLDSNISKFRIVIPFSKIALFTVSLPFFGFIFCIVWSVIYNFEHSTSTHCNVYNFLPSVSAAIGHYKPQSDLWKAAIAVQAVIRTWVLIMYYYYYKEVVYKWAQGICNFALLCYTFENAALVTLSFWSSNENYAFHKLSFITFLVMSLMHMLLAYFIIQNCRSISRDSTDMKSLIWKFRMMMLNITFILLACYAFYRHNTYCEPYVYSVFALSEYLVVITNMGFHLTAVWDFAGKSILVSSNGVKLI